MNKNPYAPKQRFAAPNYIPLYALHLAGLLVAALSIGAKLGGSL